MKQTEKKEELRKNDGSKVNADAKHTVWITLKMTEKKKELRKNDGNRVNADPI